MKEYKTLNDRTEEQIRKLIEKGKRLAQKKTLKDLIKKKTTTIEKLNVMMEEIIKL